MLNDARDRAVAEAAARCMQSGGIVIEHVYRSDEEIIAAHFEGIERAARRRAWAWCAATAAAGFILWQLVRVLIMAEAKRLR